MPSPIKYIAKNGTITYRVRFRHNKKCCTNTFPTFREAKTFCSDIDSRDAHYALKVLDNAQKDSTNKLDEVAKKFFDWKASKVRSDRTIADYRRDYTIWIAPTFGHRGIGSIDETEVQSWVDQLAKGSDEKRKLSPKSIKDKHALLHSIFSYACAPSRLLTDRNPCIGTDLPKIRKGQPKGLKPAEWDALYSALVTIDPDAADLASFLLASGFRWSEATALSAYDFWQENGHTYVTVSHVVRRDAAGAYPIVEDTKSTAGARRIAIDTDTAKMVMRRIDRIKGGGLIFTTGAGAQWHHSNFWNRAWIPAVKTAGLSRNPSPHWLRHTHVAWMIMRGASLPELQSRIGHASISTTIDVYGRMSTDVSPKALEDFAAMRGKRAIEG
jgi:integrase